MKRTLLLGCSILALGLGTRNAAAADAAAKKTIHGEGLCAKCELGETKTCQNAIKVKEGDKTVTYYLEDNETSKNFHSKICKAPAQVKATGTVKEEDGKKVLTASKIELAKEKDKKDS